MSLPINTNVDAINAANSAADDDAGLTISQKMGLPGASIVDGCVR